MSLICAAPNASAVRRGRIREDRTPDLRMSTPEIAYFLTGNGRGIDSGVQMDRMLLFFFHVSGVNNV